MLDMGFEPQIRDIVAAIPAYTKGNAAAAASSSRRRGSDESPQDSAAAAAQGEGGGEEEGLMLSPDEQRLAALKQLQTLFFSATWPQEVKAIARRFCRNDPVHLYVGECAGRFAQGVQLAPWQLCLRLLACTHGWCVSGVCAGFVQQELVCDLSPTSSVAVGV
jgi:superfamily II DNA/RNA helicase